MSESLFHYIEDLERLLEILGEGFVPNFHLEDLSGSEYGDLFRGIPMVSFSDIVPDCSDMHRQNYGNYCIGLKKEWALNCKDINPVMYVSSSSLLRIVQYDLINSDLFGYIKKYSSLWNGDRNYINCNEREWRYVVKDSKVRWMMSRSEYDEWRGDTNFKRPRPTEELKRNALRFTIDDITHLCIRSDEDKANLIEGIHNLKYFSGSECKLNENEIQRLISKIRIPI